MLSLKPPFLQIGNLMIFSDDTDNRTFYYQSQRPSIARNKEGKPKISAYAILPESGSGSGGDSISEAGLSLDVDLSVSMEDLELAKKAITKEYGRSPKILAPAPLNDGKARFIMAQAGDESEPSKWFVTSEVRPSMSGTNNTSIVARAKGDDAKLMVAAANSGDIPAGIFYELSIIGITPVYHAHLEADMSMIYHHFDSSIKINNLFSNTEISKVLDRMMEDRTIDIEIEELDPDIKAEAMKSLFDELNRKVIDTLFEPVSLLSIKESTSQKIGNGISSVLRSIIPGGHFTRRELDETQLKTITLDLSQKNAKIYKVYPQALLSSMVEDAEVDLQSTISWIKLDDVPFFSQDVTVRIASDTFSNSNINTVSVYCRVVNADTGRQVKDFECMTFDSSNNEMASEFSFIRQRGVKYHYEYKVVMYLNSGYNMISGKKETAWRSEESPYIYINPADYYKNVELDVNIGDTTVFDYATMIQADISAIEKTSGESVLSTTIIFSKDNMEHRHFVIVAGSELDIAYDIALTYFLPGAEDLSVKHSNIENSFFFIANPFENRWAVDLICKADWEKIDRVYLSTRIFDVGRPDPIENHFLFNSENQGARLNAACNLETKSKVFEYKANVIYKDGPKVIAGWYPHKGDPVLVIDADSLKSESIIRFNVVSCPNFEIKDIKKATLEIKYKSEDGDVTDKLDLSGHDETLACTIREIDQKSGAYSYRMVVKGVYGDNFKSAWTISNEDYITVVFPKDLW